MKQIKFLSLCAMFVVASVLMFSSCVQDEVENALTPIEEVSDGNSEAPVTRASSGNYVGVSETILANFVHYCQRQAGTAGGNYPNATGNISLSDAQSACNPTAYMMAAACLAHYRDGSSTSYNATGAKLAGLVSGFKAYNTSSNSDRWKSIITARDYCNNTTNGDGGWLQGAYLLFSSSQRTDAKNQLEAWLTNDKFVLVPLLAYIGTYDKPNQAILFQNTSSNPDLLSATNTNNYIRTSSGTNIGGHIVLVIRIDKDANSNEGGVVTYIDPLSVTRSSSNRKYVSYKRFLDSILASNSSYPMTAIALK
ncbi:hypothetical protein FACS1894176_06650 [Bacteroidia bacterium]|nr:hypothetical protein FACS189428_2180 [Clostridia bacterium]GHV26259.1 hypothetical protein FACS1894176_06650 [Bacteroidia bacterium]